MAYRIIPGVRQDHKGQLYQVAVWPNSSKTINVPYSRSAKSAFSLRFLQSEGGHVWHYRDGEESRVVSCGQPKCFVCSPEHGLVAQHRVISEENANG